jgi:hypothetical protein
MQPEYCSVNVKSFICKNAGGKPECWYRDGEVDLEDIQGFNPAAKVCLFSAYQYFIILLFICV